jgi:hypothetical protein
MILQSTDARLYENRTDTEEERSLIFADPFFPENLLLRTVIFLGWFRLALCIILAVQVYYPTSSF